MNLVTALILILSAASQDSVTSDPQTDSQGKEDTTFDIKAEEGDLRNKALDMTDFNPADLVTFELPPKLIYEFYETVVQAPQFVSVLFLVSSKETNDVDLIIRDPGKKIVKQLIKRKDASFKFRANLTGDYSFQFISRKVRYMQYMEKLAVTFAVHVGTTSPEQALQSDHVTPVESNLSEMNKQLGAFQMEQQIGDKQQEAHFLSESYVAVASANSKVLWFSLVECAGVVGLSIWQVSYIKNLLSNRRIL